MDLAPSLKFTGLVPPLEVSDFVPVKGMIDYGSKVSLYIRNGWVDAEADEKISLRQMGLLAYNLPVFVAVGYGIGCLMSSGLEKLLQ